MSYPQRGHLMLAVSRPPEETRTVGQTACVRLRNGHPGFHSGNGVRRNVLWLPMIRTNILPPSSVLNCAVFPQSLVMQDLRLSYVHYRSCLQLQGRSVPPKRLYTTRKPAQMILLCQNSHRDKGLNKIPRLSCLFVTFPYQGRHVTSGVETVCCSISRRSLAVGARCGAGRCWWW